MPTIEHKLKSLDVCQVSIAHVNGPAPATHQFTCTGYLVIDVICLDVNRMSIDNPISPFSMILPGNDRQYLSLLASDGSLLTILSSAAFAAPSTNASGKALRKIKGVFVSQQGPHALLTINLWQDMVNSAIDDMIDIELGYHVTILAGPAK